MLSLLAPLSGAGFGVTDYLGGRQSSRYGTVRVLFLTQTAGLIALALVSVVAMTGLPEAVDLPPAVAAGVCEIIGLTALYIGLSRGRAASVAPAAALSPVVPATVEVLGGSPPSPVVLVGAAIAVLGVVLVGATPGMAEEGRGRGGIGWGLLAGAGFGGYYTFIAIATEASGPVPALLVDRASAWMLVVVAALVTLVARRGPHRWDVPLRGTLATASIGLGIVLADLAYVSATTLGDVTVAAVLSSTHPVFTVLCARALAAEAVGWRRWAGIGVTVVGAVLISLG
jgi:drug/metabolite transporter (DMT)-like permease